MQKEKHLPINSSHVLKHIGYCQEEYKVIANILLKKEIPYIMKYSYHKIPRPGKSCVYVRRYTRFYDIEEILHQLEQDLLKPRTKIDRRPLLDIFRTILQERIEYGDFIPESTDVYKELYEKSRPPKKPVHTLEEIEAFRIEKVEARNSRRSAFLEKFKSTKKEIIWS